MGLVQNWYPEIANAQDSETKIPYLKISYHMLTNTRPLVFYIRWLWLWLVLWLVWLQPQQLTCIHMPLSYVVAFCNLRKKQQLYTQRRHLRENSSNKGGVNLIHISDSYSFFHFRGECFNDFLMNGMKNTNNLSFTLWHLY